MASTRRYRAGACRQAAESASDYIPTKAAPPTSTLEPPVDVDASVYDAATRPDADAPSSGHCGRGKWVRTDAQKVRLRAIGQLAAKQQAAKLAIADARLTATNWSRTEVATMVELVCAFKMPWTVGGSQIESIAKSIGHLLRELGQGPIASVGDMFGERVRREALYHCASAYLF